MAFLICEGRPVSKRCIAQTLWPSSPIGLAMDSLYKVCRNIRDLKKKGIILPFCVHLRFIELDMTALECDLHSFIRLYETGDISEWIKAIALYKGPLLLDNAYDWSMDYEGIYDIRFEEMRVKLIEHFADTGENHLAEYYKNM